MKTLLYFLPLILTAAIASWKNEDARVVTKIFVGTAWVVFCCFLAVAGITRIS
jgi:hypothetical protein